MWTPWLVYDIYPRRNNINILFIIKRSIMTVICVLMTYIIHTEYIMPVI